MRAAWIKTQDNFASLSPAQQEDVLYSINIRINGLTKPSGIGTQLSHDRGAHSILQALDLGIALENSAVGFISGGGPVGSVTGIQGSSADNGSLGPDIKLVGDNYAQSFKPTLVPGVTYTYQVTSGVLPQGVTLNASTGKLTGVPSKSGTYTYSITAKRVVPQGQQAAPNTDLVDSTEVTFYDKGWSIGNAIAWANKLKEVNNNKQKSMLRNFLSLYNLTITDGNASNSNGSWEELSLNNDNANHDVRNALFGGGTQATSIIQHVFVGDDAENSYPEVRKVLRLLGVDNGVSSGHYNHFHVDFRTPQLMSIQPKPSQLFVNSQSIQTASIEPLPTISIHGLVAEAESELSIEDKHGVIVMLDMIDMPEKQTVMIVASAPESQKVALDEKLEMGVCIVVLKDQPQVKEYWEERELNVGLAYDAFANRFWGADTSAPKSIELVKQPNKGRVKSFVDNAGGTHFSYLPNSGYIGNDKLSFNVSVDGKIFSMIYYLKVVDSAQYAHEQTHSELCPNYGWKISLTPDGTPIFSSDDTALTATSDYALPSADFAGYDYLPPKITFSNLTGAAIGETTGEGANATITLDTDAAGHGWYTGGMFGFGGLSLDANFVQGLGDASSSTTSTPSKWIPAFAGMTGVGGARELWDMQNWLPTSNPNEWVARTGTAAEGKMDMLSVLLHEYGHALGIEHSADAHNYMGTTLTPGMRRLPSADEMQLMAQLAAEAREAIINGQGYTLVANAQDAVILTPSSARRIGFAKNPEENNNTRYFVSLRMTELHLAT